MYSGNERSAAVGKAGEDFVANYLKSNGYIIIKRNWRDSRYGELDIVAVDVIFAKHRNGATGDIKLSFTKSISKFDNYSETVM